MNDNFKMYGYIGSEIKRRYFVIVMCFENLPRWRRLQMIDMIERCLI